MEMSDKPTTVSDFCSAQDWRAEFRHTLSSFQTWTNGTFSRRSLDIQTLGMRHLALSADMVAIAGNTAVYAWHMTDSSRNVVVPIPHPDGPSCVSLSQSYVAAGVEGCVAVYSFEQKEMIHCFTAPHSERTYIAAVYIDSLSNRIYSIGRGDFRFCIWSLSTGTCLDSFRLTSSPVSLSLTAPPPLRFGVSSRLWPELNPLLLQLTRLVRFWWRLPATVRLHATSFTTAPQYGDAVTTARSKAALALYLPYRRSS
eukprot:TRINITY_DN9684_c0_g1_i1.p1 TRINITY_DN9684_c0_g1~~TRINITY_DN9684_c0_g1_i1.p1  ORF type:complete len:255 (-),score=19.61 TRINITY_DN9684_c0_g1_i1:490-1254(-)